MTFKLRDYQDKALEAILEAEDKGIKRQLVVIPTGGGKTVVFAHIPVVRKNSLPMLVLAHREELLEQAKNKFLQVNPSLKVGIERAELKAEDGCDVVFASVASLGRSNSARISRFEPDYFRSIVVDEAHHAAAPSYGRVLDYFKADLVVGVTATPQRSDNVRLTDRFDDVVYYITIRELINDGYLSGLRGYRVSSPVDISDVTVRGGDYAEGELAAAVNIEERNELVVRSYKELGQDRKSIAFCASVQHAHDLAEAFNQAGITSESIVGTTESAERSTTIENLRSGKTQVITNVEVLTEGFDEPSLECILLAGPTRSALRYTQRVGRGTRLSEGKDHCLIIDFADVTKGKKPLGLPTLLGLPPDFDLDGGDLLEAANEYTSLMEKSPAEASKAKSLGDIELAWKQIDIFAPPGLNATVMEYSTLIWSEVGEDNFYLNISREESLHIFPDALGRFHVTARNPHGEKELGICQDIREAFSRSDAWVKKNRKDAMKLIDSSAIWRDEPPTEKQIKWLKKFGVPLTTDLTKGAASLILDGLFKENPQDEKPEWLKRRIAANRKGF